MRTGERFAHERNDFFIRVVLQKQLQAMAADQARGAEEECGTRHVLLFLIKKRSDFQAQYNRGRLESKAALTNGE